MDHPFAGDGQQHPYGADGITGLAAHTALRMLDILAREVTHGQDLDQDLPDNEKLDKVMRLTDLWTQPSLTRPPAGIPRQAEYWDAQAIDAKRRIAQAVQASLQEVTNTSGQPITVLGADGTLAERNAAFRACVQGNRPVVSVSASGCLRRWLATADPTAASLSIVTFIPDKRLYAAVVTPTAALLSDCSGSWRLTLHNGWQAMTGEPLVAEPAPGYVVLPRSLEHLAPRLREHYEEPIFPIDTTSAIVQAVLGGAVPVAVHFTEHVLDSAILPVAIGHGMIVCFRENGAIIEKPWDASRYMYNAVQGKITFGEGLVIARDLW
ncbi:hypothetical protein, partial [Streptomyces sp. NPDC002172]